MTRTLCLLVLMAVPAAAPAQPPEVLKARAALSLSFSAPPPAAAPDAAARWNLARDKAAERGVPLITFVGQPAARPPGCVCEIVESGPWEGVPEKCVVVYRPVGGRMVRDAVLPGVPTPEAVCAVAHPFPK